MDSSKQQAKALEPPSSKRYYIGANDEKFHSFMEQATSFLNTYFPNWRNYDQPISYEFPILADYNRHTKEQSHKTFKEMRPIGFDENVLAMSKMMVMLTVNHVLENDKTLAPVISVKDMKMQHFMANMEMIFPGINHLSCATLDCDCLLIGPKIGIVFVYIRIFDDQLDFAACNKLFPGGYDEQLTRIESALFPLEEIEKIIELNNDVALETEHLSIKMPIFKDVPVHKILVTPYLQKNSYDKWISSLSVSDRANIEQNLNGVSQVFGSGQMSGNIANCLHQLQAMPKDVYEKIAPLIIGLESTDRSNIDNFEVRLKKGCFSIKDALIETSRVMDPRDQPGVPLSNVQRKLISDQATRDLHDQKDKAESGSAIASNQSSIMDQTSAAFILLCQNCFTPDQLKAFNGHNRQFLIGQTDKTGIVQVLQAKVIELLKRGDSILIMAKPPSRDQYKQLFETYKFTKYEFYYYEQVSELISILRLRKQLNKCPKDSDFAQLVYEYRKLDTNSPLYEAYKWVNSADHIIIDQTNDGEGRFMQTERFLLSPLYIMACCYLINPEKVIWATLDPTVEYTGFSETEFDYDTKVIYDKIIADLVNEGNAAAAVYEPCRCRCRCNKVFSVTMLLDEAPRVKDPDPALGTNGLCANCGTVINSELIQKWNIVASGEARAQDIIANAEALAQDFIIKAQALAEEIGGNTAAGLLTDPGQIKQNVETNGSTAIVSKLASTAASEPAPAPGADQTDQPDDNQEPTEQLPAEPFLQPEPTPSKSDKIIKFLGPTRQPFRSFEEQAKYFLNTYCPNWNNQLQPEGYMLPTIFSYKHTEVSNEAFGVAQREFQKAKGEKRMIKDNEKVTNDEDDSSVTSNEGTATKPKPSVVDTGKGSQKSKPEQEQVKPPPELLTDRIGEEAEHIVYNAVQEIIQDNIQTPFIAVHGLNLHLNFKNTNNEKEIIGPLPRIYSDIDWKMFMEIRKQTVGDTPSAEYDFMLIGPKIGIIIIEVKGSFFTKADHFKSGHPHLPDDYQKAIKQLKGTKAFLYILESCTGVTVPDENCVRRVLFTPNLEKSRYDQWLKSLNENMQNENVLDKLKGIKQLFKEDTANLDLPEKPRLYTALMNILQNSDQHQIPITLYQAYAPIIGTVSSIVSQKENKSPDIVLKTMDFAEHLAASEIASKIKRHAFGDQPKKESNLTKLSKGSKLKKLFDNNVIKIFCLSQDQLKAFEGSNRQYLIGAAGTGKTVILQAKIVQLLEQGQSVSIFAPKSFTEAYQKLVNNLQFNGKYRVLVWHEFMYELKRVLYGNVGHVMLDKVFELMRERNMSTIFDHAKKSFQEKNQLFVFLEEYIKFGHIFIDDLCAEENTPDLAIMCSLYVMDFAKFLNPDLFVWAAFDPLQYSQRDNDNSLPVKPSSLPALFSSSSASNDKIISCYSISKLRQVMRCSENIFNRAYNNQGLDWGSPDLKPVLGHKIQGSNVAVWNKHFPNFNSMVKSLSRYVSNVIRKCYDERLDAGSGGLDFSNDLGIVLSGTSRVQVADVQGLLLEYCRVLLKDVKEIELDELQIIECYEVSSIEWGLVIFINFNTERMTPSAYKIAYERYYAMTRATTTLIDISVSWDVKKFS